MIQNNNNSTIMKYKTQKLFTNKSILSFLILVLVICFTSNAQLYLLGNNYTAQDLNENGTIVVGDNAQEHFMWTISNGLTLIGGVAPNKYGGTTAAPTNLSELMFIDEVSLNFASSLSVSDEELMSLSIYPNPTSDII